MVAFVRNRGLDVCAPKPDATYTAASSQILVGELSTQSEPFRTCWVAHTIRFHDAGIKRFHHPIVGDLSLSLDGLDLAADPG